MQDRFPWRMFTYFRNTGKCNIGLPEYRKGLSLNIYPYIIFHGYYQLHRGFFTNTEWYLPTPGNRYSPRALVRGEYLVFQEEVNTTGIRKKFTV